MFFRFIALDSDNPWDYLGMTSVISNDNKGWQAFIGLAQDWYTLCTTIGLIGVVINLVVIATMMAAAKNANKRAALKEGIVSKLLAFCVLFALMTILGIVVTIVKVVLE